MEMQKISRETKKTTGDSPHAYTHKTKKARPLRGGDGSFFIPYSSSSPPRYKVARWLPVSLQIVQMIVSSTRDPFPNLKNLIGPLQRGRPRRHSAGRPKLESGRAWRAAQPRSAWTSSMRRDARPCSAWMSSMRRVGDPRGWPAAWSCSSRERRAFSVLVVRCDARAIWPLLGLAAVLPPPEPTMVFEKGKFQKDLPELFEKSVVE